MARPVLFDDISPMDELLDTYFADDDCSSSCIQSLPLEELVSEKWEMESFPSSPHLSIDLDASSNGSQSPRNVEDPSKQINDDDLVNLPIQDLNKRLRNLPRAAAQKLRKRRRSLKNRRYATSCRQRRTALKESLQTYNQRLKVQLGEIKESLNKTVKDRDAYKNKYERLQSRLFNINSIK